MLKHFKTVLYCLGVSRNRLCSPAQDAKNCQHVVYKHVALLSYCNFEMLVTEENFSYFQGHRCGCIIIFKMI